MEDLRLVVVSTTAFTEEDLLLMTNLNNEEIKRVIEPIVLEERNGGENYDNDDLVNALIEVYPEHTVEIYEPEQEKLII
jgi:hypothetical protein